MAVGGRIVFNDAAYEELQRSQPIARMLTQKAERCTQSAKALAPVSADGSNGRPSGYLRSQIGWTPGSDSQGLYVDVSSPARTPTGAPYGLFQEVGWEYPAGRRHPGKPHLRPALEMLRGT